MNVFSLQAHGYDHLLQHKNPLAVRVRDGNVDKVRVGDLVDFSSHNNVMDRQRFRVVSKMHHPTVHQALSSIQHSNLSTRDKIKMTNGFLGIHGPDAAKQPATVLHLEPHNPAAAPNRSVSGL